MSRRAAPGGNQVVVEIEGRHVRLTNLDKVLWPAIGLTKADLISYYRRVAPALLPHLAEHPVTLHRFPDGVEGAHWYGTRAPAHPPWLRTQHMYTFQADKDVHSAVIDGLPALVWAANAGAIELHPYLGTTVDLWRPTAAVFDLDPGPPAGILEAAAIALELRSLLDDLGLRSCVKTSGGKGLHVYVPLNADQPYAVTKGFARAVAAELVRRCPGRVVDVMTRAQRRGKVFVDWSQNDAGKSTVAPYSLRGLRYPTVSTPVTWEELEAAHAARQPHRLAFLSGHAIERLDRYGDLFAELSVRVQRLPNGGLPTL
jgi:bifunctional non-homologous end joining protein LigD